LDLLAILVNSIKVFFHWRSLLDILLIAAGLFFLYHTLLRLGTWKIVAGIFLAVAVFLMAYILDLKGIRWIYSNLSQVALIALIVIFQPELRKLLERAASLKGHNTTRSGSDLAFLIGDAAFALAQQRRSAILVLPGKEPIKQYLSGGLSLNADPTFPLIMSIFDPNSPGHDGAVILDGGRLTNFGVRLPLSKTAKLSEKFGTRHHAAMGLSEVSDALVAVISEERGVVTSFRDGKARTMRDKNELASGILSHWEKTATYGIEIQPGRKRRRMLSQMSVSLVLALFFYSSVIISQGEIREKGFTVPIEYIAVPEKLALAGEKPTEVKLQLTGPKSNLAEINSAGLSVRIDLSNAKAGGQVFEVSEKNIALPKGVNLVDANPSSISLTLEEIVESEVDVQAQLVGSLPTGKALVSVKLTPQRVRVLLPAGESQQKIHLVTTPIYLENIQETVKLSSKIVAPPNVRPAEKKWPEVEVLITVRSRQ